MSKSIGAAVSSWAKQTHHLLVDVLPIESSWRVGAREIHVGRRVVCGGGQCQEPTCSCSKPQVAAISILAGAPFSAESNELPVVARAAASFKAVVVELKVKPSRGS
jgi:hypothetical protein